MSIDKDIDSDLHPKHAAFLNDIEELAIASESELNKLLSPKIYQIIFERSNNQRNQATIAGALAAVCILLFSSTYAVYGGAIGFLKIAIIGYLLTIIFSTIDTSDEIQSGLKTHLTKYDFAMKPFERRRKIVKECRGGIIVFAEAVSLLKKIDNEMKEFIEDVGDEKTKTGYHYDLINRLLILSTFSLLLYFSFNELLGLLSKFYF